MSKLLEDIDQQAFDQAEAAVIGLMRKEYPSLDLRRGTVLRELMVRPVSEFYALEESRYAQLQSTGSLARIASNPDAASTDDINRILSNFNMTARTGSAARGILMVKVRYARPYYIPSTFTAESTDGIQYTVEHAYNVSLKPDISPQHIKLQGPLSDQAYYFLLPAVADSHGSSAGITAGTAVDAVTSFDGFIAAEAYTDFTGGSDPETVEQLITRMPSAISYRGLGSRASIEAALYGEDNGNFGDVLRAVSVQGYGDPGQLRDKHNAHGVATGGKVDIYVRTFHQPPTTALTKTGMRIAPNTYQFTLNRAEAPGFYAVRMVTDAGEAGTASMDFKELPALGSYAITDARGSTGTTGSRHTVNPDNALVDTAGTVFQTSTVTVTGVATGTQNTHDFRVELYVPPRLKEIQDYVDSDDVRSIKADHLVRCPFICLTGVRAAVTPLRGALLDIDAMRNAVADYINSRSFVAELTESEIMGVLHKFQISRVDTSNDARRGLKLQCIVRDAAGKLHTLSGHSLNIAAHAEAKSLLLPETCVFAAHPSDIIINVSNV